MNVLDWRGRSCAPRGSRGPSNFPPASPPPRRAAGGLIVRGADEQRFDLPQEISGAKWFYEQGVGVCAGPVFSIARRSGWRVGGKQRGGGIVGLAARGANYFETSLFGFHPQIADHHLVDAGFHASHSLGRTAGRLYFKSMEFKNRFESK